MVSKVVVLGAGYAGAGAVASLQKHLPSQADLTWVAENEYHFVLHEAHRLIRNPRAKDKLTIPVDDIKDHNTSFIKAEVTDIDPGKQTIKLAGRSSIEYDYVLVALGSETATYGITGIAENALSLKSRDDALDIHAQLQRAIKGATHENPANVVIGGAGLSGIQSAGEIAEFRDQYDAPIDVILVEALPEIFPPGNPEIQKTLRNHLQRKDVTILTDDPITEATADHIVFDNRDALPYDLFLWTGGVTGPSELADVEIEAEHNRLKAESTLQTADDRVFAIGDDSLIDQGDDPAPPTAQAAWQAAEIAGKNIAASIQGRPLERWTYQDQGTLISIGEDAVAHKVQVAGISSPISTFGGSPARLLKKGAAARWINKITGPTFALSAWPVL